jgi:RTX calcium-binding nonapeptide repeat (4 copies)
MTVRAWVARVLPLLAALALLGSARAAEIGGSDANDRLIGTVGPDLILGRGGHDYLEGRAGGDFLDGGVGRDLVFGGAGNDRIAVHADGARDAVFCGPGHDLVNAELQDVVGRDCEVAVRQLSRDETAEFPAQFGTQVEPDSFAAGSTLVTAFQSGRFVDGGAALIGWATSRDAGGTWRRGFLAYPGFVSDPVVAHDAAHNTWLIAALGEAGRGAGLLVARSVDGVAWSPLRVVVDEAVETYDKEWLTCDSWRASRFRGHCYLAYLDDESNEIRVRRSSDGGTTWSVPARIASGAAPEASPNGALPVVRPDGTLLVPFTVFGSIEDPSSDTISVARSTDGGITFGAPRRVAQLREESQIDLRAPGLVSADVDAGGTAYLAWSDCRFSADCTANGIVLASSSDGVVWSPPRYVPIGAPDALAHRLVPGLAVDPQTQGRRARLAIAAYSIAKPHGCFDCELADAYLITSADGGRTWRSPLRLNVESMRTEWLANTSLGRMFGDYISASFVGGRPVPVLSLAAEPDELGFRQAIYAATSLPP